MISREQLLKQLRAMPSSLNDACRTMELAADFISGGAQALPPVVDRAELVALLEDLASVNLSREACTRQAARMADDLIARGLALTSTPSHVIEKTEGGA